LYPYGHASAQRAVGAGVASHAIGAGALGSPPPPWISEASEPSLPVSGEVEPPHAMARVATAKRMALRSKKDMVGLFRKGVAPPHFDEWKRSGSFISGR
jgi:hypothetical protein